MKNIEMYDMLPPDQAVARAWGDPGRSPHTHREALDRLVDTGRKA